MQFFYSFFELEEIRKREDPILAALDQSEEAALRELEKLENLATLGLQTCKATDCLSFSDGAFPL